MANSWKDECVCDLTFIMSSRLLCGLYSRRAVPPRWQGIARAYCVTLAIVSLLYIYLMHSIWHPLSFPYWISVSGQYFPNLVVSLWTADEYIYNFFARNNVIDVTLDSPMVFKRFHKQLKTSYVIALALYIANTLLSFALTYEFGLFFFVTISIPSAIFEFFISHACATKMLVMGLFNSRLLALRRKLERYGFRTIGRARPQPYCQIYDEIWQGLDAVSNPLKLLLFLDLIFNCLEIISTCMLYIFLIEWQYFNGIQIILAALGYATALVLRLVLMFGHVIMLESAAGHCEAMAVFTATQLIKTPSAAERRRMYALLRALEQRGARYRVLRALPIDARLVLSVLGFCSAQALVLMNMFKATF